MQNTHLQPTIFIVGEGATRDQVLLRRKASNSAFMALCHTTCLEAAVKDVCLVFVGEEEVSKASGKGYRTIPFEGCLGLKMLDLDRVCMG